MKYILKICIIVLFPLVVLGSNNVNNTKTKNEAQKSLLFVMEGQSASFSKKNGKTYINIKTPITKTLWFYDRPFRGMGYIDTKDMVSNWKKMFKSSNPNVAITYKTESYSMDNNVLVKTTKLFQQMVLVFSNPIITKDGILQFEVKAMPNDKQTNTIIHSNLNLHNISMFIDDGLFINTCDGKRFGNGITGKQNCAVISVHRGGSVVVVAQ